jgi:cob(I)alamin adenosyltransferase
MVRLNRITTRSGDDGSTALGDGTRVAKTHPRVAALGALDELNAAIGVVLATATPPERITRVLRSVQNDLFDAGAEMCFPAAPGEAADTAGRCGIGSDAVARLEELIADATTQLAPLESFVLPGGTPLAAALHMARTVCRRAERSVLELAEIEPVGAPLRRFLNRLSDLLFVYARLANDGGRGDVLWQPGGTVPPSA